MTEIQIDADLAFSASAYRPVSGAPFDTDGFNEYGVRVNEEEDGSVESVDVIFRAMEPGLRKEIRVTESFLRGVADDFSGSVPVQYDHDKSQRSNVGSVFAAWTSDALYLAGNIPNTGSTIRTDTIADFTHEPPAITDGSVGFGRDYEIDYNEAADEYQFVSATLNEFSLTPFPAGYDRATGGLSPAFCEAADLAFDDGALSPENKVGESHMRRSHAHIRE
jgi:hypothetical protein